MKKVIYLAALIIGLVLGVSSCNKDDDNDTPTTGAIKGTVTDNSGNPISGVKIIVYDANTNAPTENNVSTGSDGKYQIDLPAGTYYLILGKQGYSSIPAAGVTPVYITSELGKESVNDFTMSASSVVNGGSISGKVTSGGNVLAGVLITANNGVNGYSSVTGANGDYIIYNIPEGTYTLKGYLSKYNSDTLSVVVTANTETTGKNLNLTAGATGAVTGNVTFLATNNGAIDVTLTNPLTKETIPGLVTNTGDSAKYLISNIPNGKYIVRASYANDNYVVDPDWILKNGEPMVTIAGNKITQNFSVTGAIKVSSPTNDSASVKPVEITGTTPTFTWVAYPSTSDYIIEVSDINGNVIWGGFTKSNGSITKNIVIKSSQLSITFNSDGKASSSLKTNTVYRWKVYASKNDTSTQGWHLISVSEDQRGLFIIK
jgi:hypothetical protein